MFCGFAAIDFIGSLAAIDISGSSFSVVILSGIGAGFYFEKLNNSKLLSLILIKRN
tara:strand:- start:341 stop:508 length:168 start_codon:yes stop_codon:yes gene_type:complete